MHKHLFLFLFSFISVFAVACDEPADSDIRRDQLGSDIRFRSGSDDDLASEVRTKEGLSNPRFNSITRLSPTSTASGDITLTAADSLSTAATVELRDGVATCVESGATLDRPHLLGADLRSGLMVLESDEGSMTCASSSSGWQSGSYSLYVGDVRP